MSCSAETSSASPNSDRHWVEGNRCEFSVVLNNPAQRFIRVMIKKALPALAFCLRQKLLLHFERFYRIKVVAHDPRKRHVRAHRHQIGKAEEHLSAAAEFPTFHRTVVARARL